MSADRQGDRDEPHLPPRPRFLDVVGAVQRIGDPDHRRRTAPQRDQQPECEHAAVVAFARFCSCSRMNRQHVRRARSSPSPEHRVDRLRRHEARERDHAHYRRHQRQEEVVGQLRGEAEHVVRARFLDRSRGSSRQVNGMSNARNMPEGGASGLPVKRVMTARVLERWPAHTGRSSFGPAMNRPMARRPFTACSFFDANAPGEARGDGLRRESVTRGCPVAARIGPRRACRQHHPSGFRQRLAGGAINRLLIGRIRFQDRLKSGRVQQTPQLRTNGGDSRIAPLDALSL